MSLQGTLDFINAGVSRFHAAATAAEMLEAHGFVRLSETEIWPELKAGQGYYLTRNGSAVVAFRQPEKLRGYRMIFSHGDSPSWGIKQTFPPANGVTRLDVEPYGGVMPATWLDRPLTCAGRAMIREGNLLREKLVHLKEPVLVIPSVCGHFRRKIAENGTLNAQVDLPPIMGGEDCPSLMALAAEQLGVEEEQVLSLELTLAVQQPAVLAGCEKEFFLAPRIDDLECAAASLQAFLSAGEAGGVSPLAGGIAPIWVMLDNEEVGSSTRQGASGTFVWDVLSGIAEAHHLAGQGHNAVLANSLALSADNGHAVHPNHPESSNPLEKPKMNHGIILKVNSNKKYTTDGITGAIMKEILEQRKIPYQTFSNRADIPGGSTLGNLQQHSVSIPMADIGAPQLAMHAAVETAGCRDAETLEDACRAFYEAAVTCIGAGQYRFG